MIQYLAGIFDSEGYVRIRKVNNFYTVEAKIYITSLEVISKFAEIYGVEIKSEDRGKHKKLAYYVAFGKGQLLGTSFIEDILPFLNEKRLQLQEVKNLLSGQDKEECYQRYLLTKKEFTHSIQNELSFEYLAGIIDGDGWLSMHNAGKGKSFYNKYSVGLQQRYKPLINYMNRFEGSQTHTCKVYDYQSHVQTYSWQNTTASILPFLKSIEPFLIEKKEKCETLIKYIEKYEEFRQYSKEVLTWWKE
jgi:hypothetical protein